jgi:hypothetical protein
MTLANDRPPEYFTHPDKPVWESHLRYNRVMRALDAEFGNLTLVDFGAVVKTGDDILDINHLRRDLYFKVYQDMISKM